MVGMSTIVYKYSFSNKSDDTIDSIIIEFLKQYKPQYNRSYLGFDSAEKEEQVKDKILEYELLSLRQNKTRQDHRKLLEMSLRFLKGAETVREVRWWCDEAIHHLNKLSGGEYSLKL